MDLGPKTQRGGRKLYYHALSSVTENWVYTDSLKNQSIFGEYPWIHPNVFNVRFKYGKIVFFFLFE